MQREGRGCRETVGVQGEGRCVVYLGREPLPALRDAPAGQVVGDHLRGLADFYGLVSQ